MIQLKNKTSFCNTLLEGIKEECYYKGGGKGGGGGGEEAILKQARRAEAFAKEGRKMGLGFLGESEKKVVTPLYQLQDPALRGARQATEYAADFEPRVAEDVERAQQAYLEPSQRMIQEQIGNLAGQLGAGGLRTSRGQRLLGRAGEEMGAREAQRRLQLEQSVRGQKLGEQAQLQGLAMSPLQYLTQTEMGLGGRKAGIATGTGQQLAGMAQQTGSQLAQAQQAAASQRGQKKGGAGQLAGTLAGAGAAAFSDERLKENIVPVGKLDNGLTVYSFNFKGSNVTQIGLIAQEVQKVNPSAVQDGGEFLKVDYKEATK